MGAHEGGQEADEVERLFERLNKAYHGGRTRQAARLAERLALAIEEPSEKNYYIYAQYWVLIHAARGDYEKAVQVQRVDIERFQMRIENGWYRDSRIVTCDEVQLVQELYYFLALDLFDHLNEPKQARDAIAAAIDLAERYSVSVDPDLTSLLARIEQISSDRNI